MKRVAVVGTLVWDRIWHPGASRDAPVEQWGGIAYSLAALSAVCPPGWVVVPVLRVGRDLADAANAFLHGLPNIQVGDSVTVVAEPNNRVELRYRDRANRTETLTGGVSAWRFTEVQPLLSGADALYLNFISGYEIDLETAERLGRDPIPTYADLHSLFLGPPTEGVRAPRRPDSWRQWVAAFDAVQMNQTELELLGIEDILAPVAEDGPALLAITLGDRGSRCVFRDPLGPPVAWPARRSGLLSSNPTRVSPQRRTLDVGPAPAVENGDPTGCGDVWGSVMFAGLLEGLAPERAMRRANVAAATRLGVPDVANLRDSIVNAVREQLE